VKRALAGIVLLCTASGASAAGTDVVQGLADVLAAEAFCDLAYDQNAIAAFIEKHVAADDLDFTGDLKGLIFIAERTQQTMSASAATAHCTQVRRLAATYGFINP